MTGQRRLAAIVSAEAYVANAAHLRELQKERPSLGIDPRNSAVSPLIRRVQARGLFSIFGPPNGRVIEHLP